MSHDVSPVSPSSAIVLTTLNARYMHASFGLRYLYANLGGLQTDTRIEEFTIHQRPADIAEMLLASEPEIIGFGVYIWNLAEVTRTVALIKQVSPQTCIILGGPEVSHHPDVPEVCALADVVIAGAAEKTFRETCEALLAGRPPLMKFIQADEMVLDDIELPYEYYDDEDVRNRLIYVEASRGCPYKCEFCLSSLDKTAKAFDQQQFLSAMDKLFRRGVRNFKFIDRTFNLKLDNSIAILEFFLERMEPGLYLHFEVVPDNIPDRLKQVIQRFPPHALQFEIGVQTFDEDIQQRISRRQNNAKTVANLSWLREHSEVYIHADLIFGLPGDTMENFADSFDRLVALAPHEIQLGILKRLRGAPLNRHNADFGLRYNPEPPYNVLATDDIDFTTMQRVSRFARFWDMIANSGKFRHSLPVMLKDSPFAAFLKLSDALYAEAGSTWKISQRRLFALLYSVLSDDDSIDHEALLVSLEADFERCGEKGRLNRVLQTDAGNQRSGVANLRQLKALN